VPVCKCAASWADRLVCVQLNKRHNLCVYLLINILRTASALAPLNASTPIRCSTLRDREAFKQVRASEESATLHRHRSTNTICIVIERLSLSHLLMYIRRRRSSALQPSGMRRTHRERAGPYTIAAMA
jgi:hypothetical protein